MRMSPAELIAHHEPAMAVEGTQVVVTFREQGPARAFRDGLVAESTEIPRDATRLVRTVSLQEGPEPHRAILELVDGDMRAHRFFVRGDDLKALSTPPLVVESRSTSQCSVEEVTDEKGDLAVVLRLHGEGRVVEVRLSPYLAASLSGCLGQFVAKAIAEPRRER